MALAGHFSYAMHDGSPSNHYLSRLTGTDAFVCVAFADRVKWFSCPPTNIRVAGLDPELKRGRAMDDCKGAQIGSKQLCLSSAPRQCCLRPRQRAACARLGFQLERPLKITRRLSSRSLAQGSRPITPQQPGPLAVGGGGIFFFWQQGQPAESCFPDPRIPDPCKLIHGLSTHI